MNIYIILLNNILVIHAFIKSSAECLKKEYPHHIKLRTGRSTSKCPYTLIYKHLQNSALRKDVITLSDLEFYSTIDFLFRQLLHNPRIQDKTNKQELFSKIIDYNIDFPIIYFKRYLGYSFKDDTSMKKCIDRIKRRLNFIVIEGIITEEY
ncbi:gamete antigen 27/25 [Plasmodium brasilianum]|uniref:Uncharacterized protein n=2 Tax=Plasmodium (Plasmodium) TaxID=418103 RepID=A0A1A8WX33_PLAMA|nr:gamete antigen 27/25 [Plasmodium brasilianum]SBS96441.1 hypothetical protein PMALA_053930 [Plasmodium malariae]